MECDLKERFNEVIREYGKNWKQVLTDDSQKYNHITEHPQFQQIFIEFTQRLTGDELNAMKQLQEDLLKANDIDPETMHGQYYCSLCTFEFISFGARFQHYQNCVGLKRHYERVKQQM